MNTVKRAGLIAFLTVLLAVIGCAAPGDKGASSAQASEISRMEDFTLEDAQGQKVNLSALLKTHKAVLVNFWATWCPPCREEIPGLIELQKSKGGAAFTILGVDIGESPAKVSNFVQKIGINYPVALDRDQSVAEKYRVVGIPTSYLVSSDGNIIGEYHAYSQQLVEDVEKATR